MEPRNRVRFLAEGFVVEPRFESENVEVPGSLLPVEETQIRPEVTGRVVQLQYFGGISCTERLFTGKTL